LLLTFVVKSATLHNMSKDTWEFINTFAPWLAAVATFAAVIVSLYLARRQDIHLRVTVGIWKVAGGPRPDEELVMVDVVNASQRPVRLEKLFWKPVPWSKAGLLWIAPKNAYSSSLPTTIGESLHVTYASPLGEFKTALTGHARKEFSGLRGWYRVRFLRFCVMTTTGQTFKAKPTKELRSLLRGMAKSNT